VEIVVGDAVDIGDPRIPNVDVAEVARAGVIPREEGFTESQWAPAETSTEAETKSDSEAGSAPP
jgi:hypothetical protein